MHRIAIVVNNLIFYELFSCQINLSIVSFSSINQDLVLGLELIGYEARQGPSCVDTRLGNLNYNIPLFYQYLAIKLSLIGSISNFMKQL